MAIGGAIRSFVAGYVGALMDIGGGWLCGVRQEADWPLHEDERDEGKTPPVKRKKSKEKKGIKKEADAKSENKVEARRREWGCWG
ncbi:hypothetical protein L3X38_010145 [Prunus dulcis]|uniref:Uncharacterized protein n=2 Tax=Prunus dulcis TaxID=3755 RepID=A0AAD4WEZ7_PRUDU|nr:hypothetical protein L3X38_010145 [Prunus dulcis]